MVIKNILTEYQMIYYGEIEYSYTISDDMIRLKRMFLHNII